MADNEKKEQTFASIYVGTFYSAEDRSVSLKLSIWKSRAFFEFLRFKKDGGAPDRETASFTFEQLGIINSVLMQIITERVAAFRSKAEYRDWGSVNFNLVFSDASGNIRKEGELYIRTVVVEGKQRISVGISKGNSKFDVLLTNKLGGAMIDQDNPIIRPNVDLDDQPFTWFAKTINDIMGQAFVYNGFNFLKDVVNGVQNGGGGGGNRGGSGGSNSSGGNRNNNYGGGRRGPQTGRGDETVDF